MGHEGRTQTSTTQMPKKSTTHALRVELNGIIDKSLIEKT